MRACRPLLSPLSSKTRKLATPLSPSSEIILCYTPIHWRQTQPLLRSNRAGVRWLSQDLCPRREESPGHSKVGAIAATTSIDQSCTVMDEINENYLQLP